MVIVCFYPLGVNRGRAWCKADWRVAMTTTSAVLWVPLPADWGLCALCYPSSLPSLMHKHDLYLSPNSESSPSINPNMLLRQNEELLMCEVQAVLPLKPEDAPVNFSNTFDLLLITLWQQSAHPPPVPLFYRHGLLPSAALRTQTRSDSWVGGTPSLSALRLSGCHYKTSQHRGTYCFCCFFLLSTHAFSVSTVCEPNEPCCKLTDNLSIAFVVSGNRKAFLDVDTAPVAASWLPLRGLPALAGCVHDATGVIVGATGQALLQPLAQHLAGRHARVPLPHNQKLGLELADIVLSLNNLQGISLCHFADLQELFAWLQVGDSGWSVAQPDHLIKALHAQVGAGGLNEGVELEGPDLARHTGVSGLGDFHVDSVAARIGVLQGPGAWCGGQGGCRGENTKEATLFQGGAGGRGRARGCAWGQTEEEQDEGHTGAGKSWPRHWVGLGRQGCCSCFCDFCVWFDFFVASYCTCFRSFDLSTQTLWRIVGFVVFSVSDRGSCREKK